MDFKTLLVHAEGGVWTLTLNRPERRNAMSLEMVRELRAALAQAEMATAVRAIVLRGADGNFCSGGDISDMASATQVVPKDKDVDPVAEIGSQFGRLCLAFGRSHLPIVAVLEGAVMGGGFGLACVADVALASATAKFRLPEASLGLVPAQIAPFLVERIGYGDAKRLAVTGAPVDAAEALRIRLVHEVHPSGEALEAALAATLKRVLSCAPGAIAATKALLLRARFEPPEKIIDDAASVFATAFRGPRARPALGPS